MDYRCVYKTDCNYIVNNKRTISCAFCTKHLDWKYIEQTVNDIKDVREREWTKKLIEFRNARIANDKEKGGIYTCEIKE